MKCNVKKTSVYAVIIIIVLVLGCLAFAAYWESDEHVLQEVPASSFPTRTSAQMSKVIEQELKEASVVEVPIERGALTWTQYEYRVPIESRDVAPRVINKLSRAIQVHGGEIFQTYSQPEQQQTTLVLGIGTFITHTIIFTWPSPTSVEAVPAPSKESYKAAIVIDDLGANKQTIFRLLELGEDLTFSVLPYLELSTEVATILHQHQKEILLHLPMEPNAYPEKDPGLGVIVSHMGTEQIQRTLEQDLQAVPFAVGVNNHMGSRLTSNREKIKTVLQILAQHNLFFLDSRTTSKTVAYAVAQQLGLKSAERKVFLDADEDLQVNTVKKRLYELIALAEQGKPAIAIGHPKEVTLQALEEMMPEFKRRNVQIIRVSQFMH